jgi:hypothetical protein
MHQDDLEICQIKISLKYPGLFAEQISYTYFYLLIASPPQKKKYAMAHRKQWSIWSLLVLFTPKNFFSSLFSVQFYN